MNRAFIIANWDSLTQNERMANFQGWMGIASSASGHAQITQLVFHTSLSSDDDYFASYTVYEKKPIMQVSVAEDLFTELSSDDAIATGDTILSKSIDYYDDVKAQNEYDKNYEKQLNKWLQKMQKELQKDMAKAYAEMAKYFKEKYADFKS